MKQRTSIPPFDRRKTKLSHAPLILVLLLVAQSTRANDGAFKISGNHLIPTIETQIQLRKEVLTMKLLKDGIDVTVHYELFNPGSQKTVMVGFEAGTPAGDVNGLPIKGEHPYMRDFNVKVNESVLPYSVQYRNRIGEKKHDNAKKVFMSLKEVLASDDDPTDVQFEYIYSFQAKFEPGLNSIDHHYFCEYSGQLYGVNRSSDVILLQEFSYVLSAANRWANRGIDDFTLILETQADDHFAIERNFFAKSSEWTVEGVATLSDYTTESKGGKTKAMRCVVKGAALKFHKLNFKPSSEFKYFKRNTE